MTHNPARHTRTPTPAAKAVFAIFATVMAFHVASVHAIADVEAKAPPLPEKVTFAEHIAPIIFSQCSSCHRPGQAGPFSLLSYADVRKRARTIEAVIEDRYMPPWKPAPGHGEFEGVRRLSDREIAMFSRWVEQGRSPGDPAKQPPAPKFNDDGWALGKPDIVLSMKQAFVVPADGPDIYRWFVLPLALPEDKWVKAVEFRPSSRSVVHHSLFFLDNTGQARKLDGQDGKPGFRGMRSRITGRLGGYVPGAVPKLLPKDLAMPLPKGSDILLQTHFHPTGKVEREQSTLAIYLADKPPSQKLFNVQVPPGFGRGAGINVPAGEKAYTVRDSFTLPVDVVAWSVGGHAHYICSKMKMHAVLPDGKTLPLLYIDDWDLDWQDNYRFKKPVSLPAGAVVHTTLVYDNSAANPDNPFNPPRRIKWGRESTDEMGSVTLVVTAAQKQDERKMDQALRAQRVKLARGAAQAIARDAGRGAEDLARRAIAAAFKRYDKNNDNKLQRSEAPPRLKQRIFDRLDKNKDGALDVAELEALGELLGRFRKQSE